MGSKKTADMQEVYIDEEINGYFDGGMSDSSINCRMRTEVGRENTQTTDNQSAAQTESQTAGNQRETGDFKR